MDNARKRNQIYPASVQFVIKRWLRSAEKSRFGTGPTKDVAPVILGGKTKPNGTALGKESFPKTGRSESITTLIVERNI